MKNITLHIQKIAWILFLTFIVFFFVIQFITTVYTAIIFYTDKNINYEKLNVLFVNILYFAGFLLPLLLCIFTYLTYKGKFLFMGTKKKNISFTKRCKFIARILLTTFVYWVLIGIAPVMMIIFFIHKYLKEKFVVLIPVCGLFLEVLLILIMFKQYRKSQVMAE